MTFSPPKRFRRILAILKKEFRQIRRDRLSLGLLLFIPALLLVLYGYALSFDVKHIALGVLDLDRTQESRRFLDGVFQNPYFDRVQDLTRIEEADALLARRTVWAVLVVPRGFAKEIARGDEVPVQFLVDGSDANSASITVNYLEALTQRATLEYRTREAAARGLAVSLPGVVPQTRIWFNPDFNAAIFLVPGLIGMLLMLSAVIATSLSIVREKERDTMDQIMVSPVKPPGYP